MALGSTQPIT